MIRGLTGLVEGKVKYLVKLRDAKTPKVKLNTAVEGAFSFSRVRSKYIHSVFSRRRVAGRAKAGCLKAGRGNPGCGQVSPSSLIGWLLGLALTDCQGGTCSSDNDVSVYRYLHDKKQIPLSPVKR